MKITDMENTDVEVPERPERIACLHCVSPERVLMLGAGDRIRLMSEPSPWARKLFPELKENINRYGVSAEQMCDMNIDLVFFSPGMDDGDLYRNAGLPTVCSFSEKDMPSDTDEFISSFCRQVSMFGKLLGPASMERAEVFNDYFAAKVRQIYALTSGLEDEERPRVYYGGKGNDMLHTQGRHSVMHWNAYIAGADYLPGRIEGNYTASDINQVKEWDPEYIFMTGYLDSKEKVTDDPAWQEMTAVKNGRVFTIPRTVLAWDHASAEGILLMIYMAKILHPSLFKDWNMKEEMRSFYKTVYGREISEEDCIRILNHQMPE